MGIVKKGVPNNISALFSVEFKLKCFVSPTTRLGSWISGEICGGKRFTFLNRTPVGSFHPTKFGVESNLKKLVTYTFFFLGLEVNNTIIFYMFKGVSETHRRVN